jgi:hypothetical protein
MAYQPSQKEAGATFRGRACSFRTPGRAGTAGQKLFSIFNPSGTTAAVVVNQLAIDIYQTAVKAATVAPPLIRVHKITVQPTNGTTLTRVPKDSLLPVSGANAIVQGDASADGTSSASALTHATANGGAATTFTQEFTPRLITAAGYEMFDRTELLEGKEIILRASEGLLVFLDYTAATQNPITDMWMLSVDWYEIP